MNHFCVFRSSNISSVSFFSTSNDDSFFLLASLLMKMKNTNSMIVTKPNILNVNAAPIHDTINPPSSSPHP